jgi:hypothetical protein
MRTHASIVIAVTALVVAVFGSTPIGEAAWNQVVPRNSVGTLQLQRNAVKASKVAPNAIRTGHVLDGSLLTADFKAGQIPQGPKGDKGDKGAKGDQGPPGVSGYEIVSATSSFDSATTKAQTATCPSGKRAVGGGAIASGALGGITISNSQPNSSGTSWIAQAFEIGTVTVSWQLTTEVICVNVAP